MRIDHDDPRCMVCGQPASIIYRIEDGDPETARCEQHAPPPLPPREDDTPGYAAWRSWRASPAGM